MTTAPLILRPVATEDLPAVVAIEGRAFADPWSPDAFESAMGLPQIRFLVAEEGEGATRRIVGYVLTMEVGDEGEVANIAVDPSSRRLGIGAALLDRALADGARAGVRTTFLEVRESNVAARTLYESRGFVAVGRRKGYYRLPVEDAVVLRRESGPM